MDCLLDTLPASEGAMAFGDSDVDEDAHVDAASAVADDGMQVDVTLVLCASSSSSSSSSSSDGMAARGVQASGDVPDIEDLPVGLRARRRPTSSR